MSDITLDLAADGQLLVHVPGANRGHPFKLPFDLRGLACLYTILMERQRGKTSIGQRGAPTQWNVDEVLRAMQSDGAKQLAGRARERRETLAKTGVRIRTVRDYVPDFDLDLSSLDL